MCSAPTPAQATDDSEREAFIAGFICAGGEAIEAKKYAESFVGCMRHYRAETGIAREAGQRDRDAEVAAAEERGRLHGIEQAAHWYRPVGWQVDEDEVPDAMRTALAPPARDGGEHG